MSDRLTVDTINSDQLDALQMRAARMEHATKQAAELAVRLEDAERDLGEMRGSYQGACRTIADMHAAAVGEVRGPIRGVVEDVADVRERAGRAEAALARVREALRTTFLAGPDAVSVVRADAIRAALGPAPRCEPKSARGDHPIHELLAALKAGVPHPAPTEVVGRYYRAIHDDCCPYDHSPVRPGYAAAANRAALDESRHGLAEVVHPEANPQASEPHTVDEQPGCACTYGQRCPNCRD